MHHNGDDDSVAAVAAAVRCPSMSENAVAATAVAETFCCGDASLTERPRTGATHVLRQL